MRRDKDLNVYTNCLANFARDATAATKRPARLVTKKTRAAIAVLTLLSSPAMAGPPYITDDPEPVDYRRWEFYAFSQGGRANGETSGVAPSCDCNYGVLPDVQLHIQPGAAFRRASGASPAWGPGDTELGLKYRFVEQDKTNATPSIAFYPLLEAPTGDPTRGLGAGRTRAFLPFWGQKDFGDWSTFGGGGYWINPGPGAKTIGSSAGSCSASSPNDWRSASSCSTRRRPRFAGFRRPASTSARSTISANIFTCSPRPARAFSTRGRPTPSHGISACKSPASSSFYFLQPPSMGPGSDASQSSAGRSS